MENNNEIKFENWEEAISNGGVEIGYISKTSLAKIADEIRRLCLNTKKELQEEDLLSVQDMISTLENMRSSENLITGDINPNYITNATTIVDYAFYGQQNLEFFDCATNAPVLTSIGGSAFEKCINLKGVSPLTYIKTIGLNAFASCSNLNHVVIDSTEITTIPHGCFKGCAKLTDISLPDQITTIEDQAFMESGLLTIELPIGVSYIGRQAFRQGKSNTGLYAISLPNPNQVCELEDNTVFTNTHIKAGNGRIYVPTNLVTSYQNDSSWSQYKNIIQAIETSPFYAGDFPV